MSALNNTMRWILPLLGTMVLLAAAGLLVGFTAGEEAEARYEGLEVEVERIDGVFFVDAADVRNAVERVDSIRGSFVADVDLAAVQTAVAALPAVADIEVYPGLDRQLHVKVAQRRPIARWHRDAERPDVYLDEQGLTMPLSRQFTARVPVIHAADSAGVASGLTWVRACRRDPNMAAFTDQIIVAPKSRELTIVPRIGMARVVVGEASDLALQWGKLSIFYREQIARGNLNEFKQVRLDYAGQVVATRY